MKKIWSITWKVAIVAAIVVIGVFVNKAQKKTQIKDMNITVNYPESDTLVTQSELRVMLEKNMGQIIGKEIKEVEPHALEVLLHKNPYVADVNVFMSLRGNLSIEVLQRKAILRVYTPGNQTFYIDQKGNSFPISTISASHVPVGSGKIYLKWNLKDKPLSISELKKDSVWKTSGIVNMFDLAMFIDSDPFLKSQIDQIYLNAANEFELIPKVGNQIILLGKADNLNEKFEKLVALYKNGFSAVGWGLYKTIDLRFKNQVVCTKK